MGFRVSRSRVGDLGFHELGFGIWGFRVWGLGSGFGSLRFRI